MDFVCLDVPRPRISFSTSPTCAVQTRPHKSRPPRFSSRCLRGGSGGRGPLCLCSARRSTLGWDRGDRIEEKMVEERNDSFSDVGPRQCTESVSDVGPCSVIRSHDTCVNVISYSVYNISYQSGLGRCGTGGRSAYFSNLSLIFLFFGRHVV